MSGIFIHWEKGRERRRRGRREDTRKAIATSITQVFTRQRAAGRASNHRCNRDQSVNDDVEFRVGFTNV
jgi:hypothetical protein